MEITWRDWLHSSRGRGILIFCVATLVSMVLFMPIYYREILAPKVGILLNDPILNFFTPSDWSNAVFFILTVALVQTLFTYANKPAILLTGILTYCLVNILRTLTMYAITLEPPADMILLIDPISASLVYPEKAFAKDLFFSGHVSTMMAMVYVERNRYWYLAKLAGTSLMALFLAWQHVHYTVDLLAAPMVTYLIYLGARRYVAAITPKKIEEVSAE
ncbi:MAG: hypothetical protein JNL40_02935 [Cyclobacteriaceae bacterium]|nr:hypothetical protein [Cyclobacteriaceae bacterium]